jgi:hypothetical protein
MLWIPTNGGIEPPINTYAYVSAYPGLVSKAYPFRGMKATERISQTSVPLLLSA